MSDCAHEWETEEAQVRYCYLCMEYEINILRSEVADLKRQLAERRMVTGEQIRKAWIEMDKTWVTGRPRYHDFAAGYFAALEAGDE